MPDATCAGCGCACDDIEVTVANGRLVGLARTCPLGDAWFAERGGERPLVARIDGRTVRLGEAVDAAAAILGHARAPLVYGLGQTSCEAQRRAVALAEASGPCRSRGRRRGVSPSRRSARARRPSARSATGRAGRRLAGRPAVTHPRLLGRLRVDRAARGSRALVVVDAQRTATAEQADAFIALDAAHDFEALWALRALVRARRCRIGSRLPLDGLDGLAVRLLGARHVALIHGALDELGALALFSLVRDLSRDRHAVTLGLRADGNARGAEDVLAWQPASLRR